MGLGCLSAGWRYFPSCNSSGNRVSQTGQRIYRQVHEDGKVLLIPEVDVETVDEAEIDTDEKKQRRDA